MSGLGSLKDRLRQLFSDEAPTQLDTAAEPAEFDVPDATGSGFTLALKRKRRATMLRNMLANAGYDDLAKMYNVREQQ